MEVLAPILGAKVAVTREFVEAQTGSSDLTNTPYYIDHGADPNFARPAAAAGRPGVWRGTVEPVNMIDGDDFIDRSGIFTIDGGTP